MKKMIFLIILIPSILCATDRKIEEISLVSAAIADLVTQEIWESNGHYYHDNTWKNPNETNPIAGSTGKRIAIKTASTVGIIALARLLDSKGHGKTASILRWGTVSAWGAAAGWNISLSIRF